MLTSGLSRGRHKPIEVSGAAIGDFERQYLRHLVRMQGPHAIAKGAEKIGTGLDQAKHLVVFVEIAIPSVDGPNGTDDIDARRESLLDQRPGYCLRLLPVWCGDVNLQSSRHALQSTSRAGKVRTLPDASS